MIDTHSHILPGLDDGTETIPQAMDFIARASAQGVKVMFATPHCCDGVYDCKKSDILSACRDLCHEVEQAGLDIRILPGAEIRVNHDLVAQFDAGHLLTLGDGGEFLLLELPPMFIFHAFLKMIQQLKERGITPIIAHAERNPMIMTQPQLAEDLIFAGAQIQVTAASLTGDFGRASLKTARILAKDNLIFCLGSDMHPGRRYRMKAAEKKLCKLTGKMGASVIVQDHPEKILKGCDDSVTHAGLKSRDVINR